VDPFQTQYFSENLVAPEIESGTSEFVARNSLLDHREAYYGDCFTFLLYGMRACIAGTLVP
jgi:hypothetical protein